MVPTNRIGQRSCNCEYRLNSGKENDSQSHTCTDYTHSSFGSSLSTSVPPGHGRTGHDAQRTSVTLQTSKSVEVTFSSDPDLATVPSCSSKETPVARCDDGSTICVEDSGQNACPAKDGEYLCAVCADKASGNFFGASVCLPCKSFFIRCTKDGESAIQKQCQGLCDVNKQLRNRCQYCRYQRCLAIGMSRREKPEVVLAGEGQELCRVCGDLANGVHFGVFTCEGCKKFFRRGLKEHDTYVCKSSRSCPLNPRNRNNCRFCRYQKCLATGMSRDAIKMGRPRKIFLKTSSEETAPSITDSSAGISSCRKPRKNATSQDDGSYTAHHLSLPGEDAQFRNWRDTSGTYSFTDDEQLEASSSLSTHLAWTASSSYSHWNSESQYMISTPSISSANSAVFSTPGNASGVSTLSAVGSDHLTPSHLSSNDTAVSVTNQSRVDPSACIFHTTSINTTHSCATEKSRRSFDADYSYPVVLNETVTRNNFYYDPPADLKKYEAGIYGREDATISEYRAAPARMATFPNAAEVTRASGQMYSMYPETSVVSSQLTANESRRSSFQSDSLGEHTRQFVDKSASDSRPFPSVVSRISAAVPVTENAALFHHSSCSHSTSSEQEHRDQSYKSYKGHCGLSPNQYIPHPVRSSEPSNFDFNHSNSYPSSSRHHQQSVLLTTASDSQSSLQTFISVADQITADEISDNNTVLDLSASGRSEATATPSGTAFPVVSADFSEDSTPALKVRRQNENIVYDLSMRKLGDPSETVRKKQSPPHHTLQGHSDEVHLGAISSVSGKWVSTKDRFRYSYTDSQIGRWSDRWQPEDVESVPSDRGPEKTMAIAPGHDALSIPPYSVCNQHQNIAQDQRGQMWNKPPQHHLHTEALLVSRDSVWPQESQLQAQWDSDQESLEHTRQHQELEADYRRDSPYNPEHVWQQPQPHADNWHYLPKHLPAEDPSQPQEPEQHEPEADKSESDEYDPYLNKEQMLKLSEVFVPICTLMETAEDAEDNPWNAPSSQEGVPSETNLMDELMQNEFEFSPRGVTEYWKHLSKRCTPVPIGAKMPAKYRKILDIMFKAYMEMSDASDNSKYESAETCGTVWPKGETVKKYWTAVQHRMVRGTQSCMKCAFQVPGMEEIHPKDKNLLVRKNVFSMALLGAATMGFDPEKKDFRHFFNWAVSKEHPMGFFRQHLVSVGRKIFAQEMDFNEVALIFALNIVCSEKGDFADPDTVEKVMFDLLMTLAVYISSVKRISPTHRMDAMFRLMPRMRAMGTWHGNLMRNMKFDIGLMERSTSNLSSFGWRIGDYKPYAPRHIYCLAPRNRNIQFENE